MTELVNQLSNSVAFAIHKATYDPDAEKFAKKKEEDAKAERLKQEEALANAKSDKEKADASAKLAATKAAEEQERAAREKFDPWRLTKRIVGTVSSILAIFLVALGGVFGASLATNLNLYKETPYRILYAIYGFLFFFIVIPYVLGYRWWWKGKQPRFYALIPIIGYHLDNRWTAMLFSWLSFKPDCQIESLKEWIEEQKENTN